ncbi:unnamed protein product, partial [marine sediment metagenome]
SDDIDDNKKENIKTQFQIFMEIVNDLVVIIDQNEDFSIDLINKCPLLEKLGYSDSELPGKPFSQLCSQDVQFRLNLHSYHYTLSSLNQVPSILYIEVCFPLPFAAFHTSSVKLLRIS